MQAVPVRAEYLAAWVPLIRDHIEALCANGQWEPEQLLDQIASRDRQLWVARDDERVRAVVLTAVLTDNLKTVQLTHATGDGMPEWLHLFSVIEEWARAIGAKRIEAVARPGWERVLKDMRKTHVILEKRL